MIKCYEVGDLLMQSQGLHLKRLALVVAVSFIDADDPQPQNVVMRLLWSKPDYAGRLLSSVLWPGVQNAFWTLIARSAQRQ